jgi:hypothetical protein
MRETWELEKTSQEAMEAYQEKMVADQEQMKAKTKAN